MRIRTFLNEFHDKGDNPYSVLLCVQEGAEGLLSIKRSESGIRLGIITSCTIGYCVRATVYVPRTEKTFLVSIFDDDKITFENLSDPDASERDLRMSMLEEDPKTVSSPDLRFWILSKYLKVLFETLPINVLSMGAYQQPKLVLPSTYDVPPHRLVEVELLDDDGSFRLKPRMIGPIEFFDR